LGLRLGGAASAWRSMLSSSSSKIRRRSVTRISPSSSCLPLCCLPNMSLAIKLFLSSQSSGRLQRTGSDLRNLDFDSLRFPFRTLGKVNLKHAIPIVGLDIILIDG